MLDEKLEKAKKESTRKKGMLIIGIVSALVIPPVLWFSFIGLKTLMQSSGSPPASMQQQAPVNQTPALNTVVTNGQDQILSDTKLLSDTKKQELREQFKLKFSQYEAQIEPELKQNQTWMPEKQFEINELKKTSLNFFSTGEYTDALKTLEKTQILADSVIEQKDQAFKDQFNSARQNFDNDQVAQAKFHIEKALHIKPEQQQALDLLKEIKKLAQIMPLLTQVEVARAENNFSTEYKLLGQIQTISPEREGIAKRRAELESFLKEQAFAHHIDSGFKAVDAATPQLARKHLKQAKTIAPKREETSLLADRITKLERKLRINAAINEADQAIRRDDWQAALLAYLNAAKDAPQDQMIQNGITRAKNLIFLDKSFTTLLADPYQLSDPVAKNNAEALLTQAQQMEQYSFSLQLKAKELAEKLPIMQQKVMVTVISDEKTYVKVIGVGNVGHVIEKVIRLKPGRYTFEGSRNGYVSKRVKTLIPYDQKAPPIRVICDQPI